MRDKFVPKEVNKDKMGNLYSDLYKGLDKAGLLDRDYLDHLGKDGGYAMFNRASDLSLQECGTALTFILRAAHFSDVEVFDEYVLNGNIYKVLSHACELAE